MIGKSTIVWICLATMASGILYHTSYRVQEQAERLSSINRQIVAEQEAIQVLKAEWAYLNDPIRMERLVAGHTVLQPVKLEQMVTLDAIPEKLPADALVAEAAPPTGKAAPAPKSPAPAPTPKTPEGPMLLAKYGARR